MEKGEEKPHTVSERDAYCLWELSPVGQPCHHIRFSALLPQPKSIASGHFPV